MVRGPTGNARAMRTARHLELALLTLSCASLVGAAAALPASQDPPGSIAGTPSRVPVTFEENLGQGPGAAAFVARTAAGTLAVAADEGWLALPSCDGTTFVHWRLVGASSAARVEGEEQLPGVVSHLRGRDPARWVRRARTFARVRFHDVWPGIDALHSGEGRCARYDFELAPLSDASAIRIAVEGGVALSDVALSIDAEGGLVLETGEGRLRQAPPVIYQDGPEGREAIEGAFVLLGRREFGFRIGSYDRTRRLVIDPTLTFSALFGDQGSEAASCVLSDGNGGWWVGGQTSSPAFPFAGAVVGPVFGTDGFVLHFDATGTVVETILVGGANTDRVVGIALDTGVLYIAGNTSSSDFPVTVGVFQTVLMGPSDAFVMKIDAELSSPVYSTYWGGSGTDILHGFAVDASTEPVLVGETTSTDFPVDGELDAELEGTLDAFASRLRSDATGPLWSGYWGGASRDKANAVDLDGDSRAIVVGERDLTLVDSASFLLPIWPDGVLGLELRADGASFDAATDVDASTSELVWVCGTTFSPDFPLEQPVQATLGGSSDAFLLNLDSHGVLGSTYWGGSGADEGVRFLYDASHGYLLLNTRSDDLPLVDAVCAWPTAQEDAYVVELGLPGGTVRWATYLPGGDDERAFDLALDDTGLLVVVGAVDNSADAPDQPASEAQGDLDGINNTNALLQVYSPNEVAGSGTVFFALDHDRATYGAPYEFFVYRDDGNDQPLSIPFHVEDEDVVVPGLGGMLDFAAGEQVARGEVAFPIGLSANPAICLGAGAFRRGSMRFMTLSTAGPGDGGHSDGSDGCGCSSWFGGTLGAPPPWHRGIQNAWWIAAVFAALLVHRRRMLTRPGTAQGDSLPAARALASVAR